MTGLEDAAMEYRVDDRSLSGETFLDFVQQVWPGAYNLEQTRAALSKTMNFTAWDGGQLAGCLRVLTDGCFFGTITELLVLPAYQRQGIGSRLLRLAAAHTPTLLYFGAQPGAEAFYEKNGCQRSLPSYLIEPKKDGAS
ncbi:MULTISPECIES: GNAT family N-acetyltransferase [Dysosmobacter]|nr:acetyltransferase, GNAT family [Oscillibacter sp. KLE 1728]ERK59322.1 acetyltransferase, GNAT family [Oscillibacter sp. KLE 1745]